MDLCEAGISWASSCPTLYAHISRGRLAVIFGSNWRKLPAAALRGLTNVFSPFTNAFLLKISNPDRGMKISPLTSRMSGMLVPRNLKGTLLMVRTLAVMSSPIDPSPLVAA